MTFELADLERRIAERAGAAVDTSWTAKLLAAGPSHAARKFGEEAVELVVAAVEGDRPAITAEAADVLFHLLVVLKAREVSLRDVLDELERRTGQSGLAEKAGRSSVGP
jgi:phosphoribosyl-ATP pyrophosphohydrolase